MTLKTIAELANVSISTVSKALSNAYDIAPATRRHILKIAEEVGYFSSKKTVKSQNRNADHPHIAILCPEIISVHYSYIATYITQILANHHCTSIIYISDFDHERTEQILQTCINDSHIDGVISISHVLNLPQSSCTPLLLFQKNSQYSYIQMQIAEAIEEAVAYLYRQGHTHIGFVSETHTAGKNTSFLNAVKHCAGALQYTIFHTGNNRFEQAGTEAARQFIHMPEPRPTALLCAYDEIAFGLLDTLSLNGIRTPQDVAVMGINNTPVSAYCFGGLTTMDPIDVAVIETAIEGLLKDIAARRTTSRRHFSMRPHLIIRHTVGRL